MVAAQQEKVEKSKYLRRGILLHWENIGVSSAKPSVIPKQSLSRSPPWVLPDHKSWTGAALKPCQSRASKTRPLAVATGCPLSLPIDVSLHMLRSCQSSPCSVAQADGRLLFFSGMPLPSLDAGEAPPA